MLDKKRGLVVIYDPHALMQFIQFYCVEGEETEWDVLCLPKEYGAEEMHTYCEKLSIFNRIFVGNTEYMSMNGIKKLKKFFSMFLYSVTGHKKSYCKKELDKYVGNVDDYDIMVGNAETGLITGMLASFGEEKRIVYLEDGVGDYLLRRKWRTAFPWYSKLNFESLVVSRLGYCCKGFSYFEPTKNCEKYVTYPDELLYRNYKSIKELRMNNDSYTKYEEYLLQLYPSLVDLKFEKGASILFTDPINTNLYKNDNEAKAYISMCLSEIGKYSNTIYLKKHPRDNRTYEFPNNTSVIYLDRDIPGECFLPFIKDLNCFFFQFSSIILMLNKFGIEPIIFYDTNKEALRLQVGAMNKDAMNSLCERFLELNYEIVDINT